MDKQEFPIKGIDSWLRALFVMVTLVTIVWLPSLSKHLVDC